MTPRKREHRPDELDDDTRERMLKVGTWLFEDREELREEFREAWATHGDRLTREWIQENPGTRPQPWWEFSAPRDKPVFAEDRPEGAPPHLSNEAATLWKLGELSAEEQAAAPGPNPAEVWATDAQHDPRGCW